MKRYRKDKSMWELFVFAVCLKMMEGSSAIHPTVPVIRKLLKCSYYKAERLIERAKECKELFSYYPEANLLIARSFTHGKLEKHGYFAGKAFFVAYSTFCFKYRYEKSETVSHFKTSRILKDKLLEFAIRARQLKHGFPIVVNHSNSVSTRANRSTALTSVKLGAIAGCHHSTATRHLRKMEDDEKLLVYRPDYIKIGDYRTGVMFTDDESLLSRRAFLRGGYIVVRDANEYAFKDECSGVFVNVIFNHKGRHRCHGKSFANVNTEAGRIQKATAHLWI